jgi:hypothetical protein
MTLRKQLTGKLLAKFWRFSSWQPPAPAADLQQRQLLYQHARVACSLA